MVRLVEVVLEPGKRIAHPLQRQPLGWAVEVRGNRQANAALHRIAVVRVGWHQQTKAYAERHKAEGLGNKDILRCLKRFIAREVLHLLMSKPPKRTAAS
jgi:hypothetical protein